MKLKVGIFFGGPSREREISFAGGRTVYDNLDAQLFEPVPIFVDSLRRFIVLDWHLIYKGSIRDFFPPPQSLPSSASPYQIYLESLYGLSPQDQATMIQEVGMEIGPEELPKWIQIAFLALHGEYGEDGQLQKELEDLGIPYTGSGVRACEIGMDKALQKDLMTQLGFNAPRIQVLDRNEWLSVQNSPAFYQKTIDRIGFPLVIRPSRQGSSIGVSIIQKGTPWEGFVEAVDRAFFRERIPLADWNSRSEYERRDHIRLLTDIRDGIGFPMDLVMDKERETIYHPDKLQSRLDEWSQRLPQETVLLEGHHTEKQVLLEEFIHGREFSCIVIRTEDGGVVALPPTEIVKGGAVFDYRSKYMPGMSRKRTPIEIPGTQIQAIRKECERLFLELGFQVYARIDGFIREDGKIFLNDPNTTSGMLPSSFFFHQAAEIGLNPSQFLTYIIRTSLQERVAAFPGRADWYTLLQDLDDRIRESKANQHKKVKVGVILGGYSFERHISVESGRNIYEKLASSEKYLPYPIFLSRKEDELVLHQIPVHLLLKDNADDIKEKLNVRYSHPIVEHIKEKCTSITAKYAANEVIFQPQPWSFTELKDQIDLVFIALHGRPGEDGELQLQLDQLEIPYNGSGPESSAITINKFQTLELLRQHGFKTARQMLLDQGEFEEDPQAAYAKIEAEFGYPLIAKPVDDGCSSAVQMVQDRNQLEAYVKLIFRQEDEQGKAYRKVLKIRPEEEFPIKSSILFETVITAEEAPHFLEITGGMLTHYQPDGTIEYEVFEPSEALASGKVLSLEEKFLAGEGQNITPARLAIHPKNYAVVAKQVKATLKRAASILQIDGYCRIDAFVRVFPQNLAEVIIIEVNSLPGMTPATAIFHQAALNQYKPFEFIDEILNFAVERKENKKNSLPFATSLNAPAMTTPEPKPIPEASSATGPSSEPKGLGQQLLDRVKEFFLLIWIYIWEFLSSPFFLKNIIGWVLASLGLLILTAYLIRGYTHHGQSLQVHNYRDMELDDAKKLAANRSFQLEVDGEGFDIDKPPGVVLQQTPEPMSEVKRNRTIYVVVNANKAPGVPIPSLATVDNYTNYCSTLRTRNINCEIRDEEFSGRLAPGTIQKVFFNGEDITDRLRKREIKIPQGSTLEMVITTRTSPTVPIPDLVCLTYKEAEFKLSSNHLVIGKLLGPTPDDIETAYVIRQEPAFAPEANITIGAPVDLYLSNTPPSNCPSTRR